jgi:hypothetical protein
MAASLVEGVEVPAISNSNPTAGSPICPNAIAACCRTK